MHVILVNIFYVPHLFVLFFFNDTATTEIYTLSLHDALPICPCDLLCVLLWRRDRRDPVTGQEGLQRPRPGSAGPRHRTREQDVRLAGVVVRQRADGDPAIGGQGIGDLRGQREGVLLGQHVAWVAGQQGAVRGGEE